MSIRRINITREMIADGQAHLTGPIHHHLCHVLRITVDTPLLLADELGAQYHGQVEQITQEAVLVALSPLSPVPRPPGPRITLIYGISRRARTEWVLQKATELGVDVICLAPCERSVTRLTRLEQKQRRWEEIINQATRQSGRPQAPHLHIFPDFIAALDSAPGAGARLLATMAAPPISDFAQALARAPEVALAVGPEGGFTPGELSAAQEHGFDLAGLGQQVLRTETAALTLLAITTYLCGKL